MKDPMESKLLDCETIQKFLENSALKEKTAAVLEILTRNSVLLQGYHLSIYL